MAAVIPLSLLCLHLCGSSVSNGCETFFLLLVKETNLLFILEAARGELHASALHARSSNMESKF